MEEKVCAHFEDITTCILNLLMFVLVRRYIIYSHFMLKRNNKCIITHIDFICTLYLFLILKYSTRTSK